MMYYLHRLSDQFIGFNVFFYVTFRAVAAAVTSSRIPASSSELSKLEPMCGFFRAMTAAP